MYLRKFKFRKRGSTFWRICRKIFLVSKFLCFFSFIFFIILLHVRPAYFQFEVHPTFLSTSSDEHLFLLFIFSSSRLLLICSGKEPYRGTYVIWCWYWHNISGLGWFECSNCGLNTGVMLRFKLLATLAMLIGVHGEWSWHKFHDKSSLNMIISNVHVQQVQDLTQSCQPPRSEHIAMKSQRWPRNAYHSPYYTVLDR